MLDVASYSWGSQKRITDGYSIAKDREWFTDYTPFKTHLGDIYGMMKTPLQVMGIGTVELPTKRSPNRTGKDGHGTLRLTNVLHAPNGMCNIIGSPIFKDYGVVTGGTDSKVSSGTIADKNGRSVAYFDATRPLFQVKLRGPPVGPHVLEKGEMYAINVRWAAEEMVRWEKYEAERATSKRPPGEKYTAEEKKWLKENYKSEFHFLRSHGLNIYKDEDREEGRSILRAIIHEEDEEEDEEMGESDSESDLDGHMADYHFTEPQLDFIKKEYGNSMNFMFSYGLKFYDNDDCEEAKLILKAIMEDDEDDEDEDRPSIRTGHVALF